MESINKVERLADPALERVLVPMPVTSRGCPSVVNVHPNESGKLIYCSGKSVVVRDVENPQQSFVYYGHNEPTTVAAFSPNGYWVASGDTSGRVRIWSYDNPEHTLKIEVFAFAGEIKDIAWGPESKRIVAVGDGRAMMARAFTWDSGNNIGEMVGHQKRILSVAYKPNRPYRIMTASEDFNVCVFEGPPFKFKQNLSGQHSKFVNCIRYSPDGSMAVSAGSDKRMVLYDGKTGDVIDTFPEDHAISVYSVSWNKDGTQILSASGDKTVKLWDVASRTVISTFAFADKPQVSDMQVAVAWMGDQPISLSLSGHINLLSSSDSLRPKQVIQGHQVSLQSLACDPSRDLIISGSYDGVVCSWKNCVASTIVGNPHTAKVTSVDANSTLVATVGWDDTLRLANLHAGDEFSYDIAVSLNGQPNGVAVCNGDASIVVVSTNKGVCLIRDGNVVFESPSFSWTATCVSLHPNGHEVAVGTDDNKIHIFQLENNSLTETGEITGHLGALTCVKYSPDGKFLAAGDTYREIRVWDVATRTAKVQGKWVFHSTRVTSVSWSPNGKFVASGSLDEHIYIWNVEDPSSKQKFDFCHKDGVTGVQFMHDGKLISCGNDAAIKIWTVQN